MSPSKQPDCLHDLGWTTADHVRGTATVILSPRAWKPKVHLDEITEPEETNDDKTVRKWRLPPVLGVQWVTVREIHDGTAHCLRVTKPVWTNGHDILQDEGIVPVPEDLRPSGSTSLVDPDALLAGGFDLAAYPVGTWLFERLLADSRDIFETLRRYDPRFTMPLDPKRVQLSLYRMEVASTVLVRRERDPIEVLRALATLAGLP